MNPSPPAQSPGPRSFPIFVTPIGLTESRFLALKEIIANSDRTKTLNVSRPTHICFPVVSVVALARSFSITDGIKCRKLSLGPYVASNAAKHSEHRIARITFGAVSRGTVWQSRSVSGWGIMFPLRISR